MARNFRIKIVNQDKKIVFKLRGDLDGSSSAMILGRMEDYEDLPLVLDFSEVRKYHPFGLHMLKWIKRKGVFIKGLKDTIST